MVKTPKPKTQVFTMIPLVGSICPGLSWAPPLQLPAFFYYWQNIGEKGLANFTKGIIFLMTKNRHIAVEAQRSFVISRTLHKASHLL
jgi:hypothetical protein